MKNTFWITLLFVVGALPAVGQVAAGNDDGLFKIGQGSSFTASTRPKATKTSPSEKLTPAAERIVVDFEEALQLIQSNHVLGKRADKDRLLKSSVGTMLSELDPHSKFFDPSEFRDLLGEQEIEYTGTGSTISSFFRSGTWNTYVLGTHPGSTAELAGLRYGDRIVAVDGVSTAGMLAEVVRDKVRGPNGTAVKITIERPNGEQVSMTMLRKRVTQPTIPNSFLLSGDVGYIGLTDGFGQGTFNELDTALNDLHRQGAKALILDLRGNTGGILDQALRVAERFLPRGSTIMSQRSRYAFDNRSWKAGLANFEKLPLVVLVDSQTASAAEIVAGALQDNDRALILGQTTFGKGLVQNIIQLPHGAGITLTSARYYTPSGRSIQRSYATSGRYDYFHHRETATETTTDKEPSRTITNRPVYAGHGIMPDESIEPTSTGAKVAALQDPVFCFGREKAAIGSVSDAELLNAFRDYSTKQGWRVSSEALASEADFITNQLRYQFALSNAGGTTAERYRITSDKQLRKAILALPRAAKLSDDAMRVRQAEANKNTRRVAYPTGQGRNRRN